MHNIINFDIICQIVFFVLFFSKKVEHQSTAFLKLQSQVDKYL